MFDFHDTALGKLTRMRAGRRMAIGHGIVNVGIANVGLDWRIREGQRHHLFECDPLVGYLQPLRSLGTCRQIQSHGAQFSRVIAIVPGKYFGNLV